MRLKTVLLLLFVALCFTVQADDAVSKSKRWAEQSVLAKGRWVKIAVEEDGVYALTKETLARMGFFEPERVKVYGYGGHILDEIMDAAWDDLEEVPLIRNSKNGDLLFWGNGVIGWDWTVISSISQHHTINPYSVRGCYFVTEGDLPAILETEHNNKDNSYEDVQSFTHYVVRNVDEYAYFSGGRKLWENKELNTARTYSLNAPGFTGETATLRVSVANGGSDPTQLNAIWNADSTLSVGTIPSAGNYESAGSLTKSYQIKGLRDGVNTLRLQAKGSDVRLDYIELSYQREFAMKAATLPFTLQRNVPSRISITTMEGQNIVLLRLGKRGRPATIIAHDENNQENITYLLDDAKGEFVAIDLNHASYPVPTIVGEVDNQNLHKDHPDCDMVIITPASGIFDEEAQRLAAAHAALDGLQCRVVRADKIYNEFSSGTPDATAYRRYMKMLYDRAEGTNAPRYLLLFGDAAWDNRMLTKDWKGMSQDDFLLCFESVNSLSDTQCYVMEDYFGMMEDGEGLSFSKTHLGIGRFPVQTIEEARVMVDKTIEHLRNEDAGEWQNLNVFMGDDGDNNSHMKYANEVADSLFTLHPEMDMRKVMWDTFKRETTTTGNTFPVLTQTINDYVANGVNMINYTGHAATYLLSHENVLSLADVHGYKNKRKGFWFTAGCDVMPFDGRADNIGEAMVLNPTGGAVAFIGTTRTVYSTYNSQINKAFCTYVFSCDPQTGRRYSIGDALKLGKNDLQESRNVVNKLHYCLLGDPSLVFGATTHRVVVDNINGIQINSSGTALYTENGGSTLPQVMAGSKCRIKGHIEDANGLVIDDFYGIVNARVLDNQETVTCLNQDGAASKAFTYEEHRKVLFEGTDSVRGGQFELSFVVPLDINYSGERGRAVFYAQGQRSGGEAQSEMPQRNNTGTTLSANGYTNSYTVGGFSAELSGDKDGPEVTLYLDEETFIDGAYVSAAPTLYATITDESGLNFKAAGLGHGLELIVDDMADMTFDLSKQFIPDAGSTCSGKLSYRLPILTTGTHSLCLRAWDVLNNPTSERVTFQVAGIEEDDAVSICITKNGKLQPTVSLINRLPNFSCEAQIWLHDITGKICYTAKADNIAGKQTVNFSVLSPLRGGIYLLRGAIRQNGVTYEAKTMKIVIGD